MSTATMNGKPQRKQLSQQLDRMDGIIDCLADALPEAVADACRDGAKAAVQQAVTDLFTHPEFLARFAELAARSARTVAPMPFAVPTPATPTPPANARPSSWERMKAKLREWTAAVTGGVRSAYTVVKTSVQTAAGTVAATARTLSNTLPVRRIVTVAVGVGLFTAAVCYLCPHWLSAVIGGAGAACTAATVQVGSWLRRSVSLFRFGG